MELLHIGAGNRIYDGFINTDRELRGDCKIAMDISKPWPYPNNSIDGIVSMHVLQQLHWRDLVFALREAYRVLKPRGVFRFGCPMVELLEWDLDYLLGWENINLFSIDLLTNVFSRIGFSSFKERGYRRSALPELARTDNRLRKGTKYFEAIK